MTLPALRSVRDKFPEAGISIVARPYVAEIYRDQHICDELIAYDPNREHKGWRGRERLATELKAKKLILLCYCRMPSMQPGLRGARESRSALDMSVMGVVFF